MNGRMEHNERLSFVSYSVGKTVLEELKQKILKYMYRTQFISTISSLKPSHGGLNIHPASTQKETWVTLRPTCYSTVICRVPSIAFAAQAQSRQPPRP